MFAKQRYSTTYMLVSSRTKSLSKSSRSISGHNAIKLLRKLNIEHQNSVQHKQKTMDDALQIYDAIETEKDCFVINEFLRLCFDYSQPHKIHDIWHDIEQYHDKNPYRGRKSERFLQYSLLLKCLIKSKNNEPSKIQKYTQLLTWIGQRNYKLSIHIALLQKLISHCAQHDSIATLRLIQSLLHQHHNQIQIQSALILAFGVCKEISTAREIFNSITETNKHPDAIHAFMKSLIKNQLNTDALCIYDAHTSCVDTKCTILAAKACIATNDMKRANDIIERNALKDATLMIQFYERLSAFEEVEKIFDSIKDSERNTAIYNLMMKNYLVRGLCDKALMMYDTMEDTRRDEVSHLMGIKACTQLSDFDGGVAIHGKMDTAKMSIQMKTTLIDFYNRANHISNAEKLFDSIAVTERDCAVFNAMLRTFIDNEFNEEGIEFSEANIALANGYSLMLLLKACTQMCDFEKGKELIEGAAIEKMDRYLLNRLIEFYGYFGDVDRAVELFNADKATNNEYTVAAMMRGYLENEEYSSALQVYEDDDPNARDDVTHVLAIKACRKGGDLDKAMQIHDNIGAELGGETRIELWNILIGVYDDARDAKKALEVFDEIPDTKRDVVSVHTLMECYYHCGRDEEVVELYRNCNCEADLLIYITLLKALTNLSMYPFGEEVEHALRQNKMIAHAEIKMNLINFYGKCGMIQRCETIFNHEHYYHVGIWNAMLRAYGRNGDIQNTKTLFDAMKKEQIDIDPDVKTYAIVMNACNHCGNVEEARNIWNHELNDEIKSDKFVRCAFVDCMARSGALTETYSFLQEHSIGDAEAWSSLLSGCRKYDDEQLAEKVLREMKSRFGEDTLRMGAAAVTMSHIYAKHGAYDKLKQVREEMLANGWRQRLAKSTVDIHGKLHAFTAGMMVNKEIRRKMKTICDRLKDEYGFEHEFGAITRELKEDEEKESELRGHSEKLALMCALLETDKSNQIVINNNLRTCGDCHHFIKLLSQMEARTFILSDPNRVHVFQNGKCSCNDYY
eukprot:368145_1